MIGKSDHPMAMSSPASAVTPVSETMLAEGKTASKESPRKRIILPFHKNGDASLQRMLNAIQPGSYIRPHRHAPDRAESIIVISGAILFITFNEGGEVESALRLKAGSPQFGVDMEGGIWHCFMATEPDTVLFEVKPGPYNAGTDKEFAPWAPEECSPEAKTYLEGLIALHR
jgi:cupin fold WbuC family metalloprotein